MKIQIIGTGIVGEATACLARFMGHDVYGYDIKSRSSSYFTSIDRPIADCDLTFVCTPEDSLDNVMENLWGVKNIVIRSTTAPGTITRLMKRFDVNLCHNPEFLRQGSYLSDAIKPKFILIGTNGTPFSELIQFYKTMKKVCRVIYTTIEMSEMTKLTLNSYLACLVSFWCEIDRLCQGTGANGREIAKIISNDKRVSGYGYTPIGNGFGGKCLPKDLRHIIEFAYSVGITPRFFEAMEEFNKCLP